MFADFRRKWWLRSGHLETIYATLSGKPPKVNYTREIIQTRDNDKLALDYVEGAGADKPLLILLHGLEGCSQSNTIRALATPAIARRWTVAAPHFRGCGGVENVYPRAYHAADADEVKWMISYCRARFEHSRAFVVGVSLGGTALVNHLLKDGATSEHKIIAATVSMPFDLPACVRQIDRGLNRRLYTRHFLKTLRKKVRDKMRRFPSLCDKKKLSAARTIGAFDELYTAPAHGFGSAMEYWQSASVHNRMDGVKTPLLCINALNDPLITAATLPPPPQNPNVVFCRPRHGGHGAFIGAPKNWLFDTAHLHFKKHAPDID